MGRLDKKDVREKLINETIKKFNQLDILGESFLH
jgi:hypothetical protein